jgi:hypothetical protein
VDFNLANFKVYTDYQTAKFNSSPNFSSSVAHVNIMYMHVCPIMLVHAIMKLIMTLGVEVLKLR